MPEQQEDLFAMMQAPPKAPTPPAARSRLEPKYAPVWEQWRADPSPANASQMVAAAGPIIDTAIRPLGNSPALRGRAKQIVLQAAGTYDPTRSSFSNHLMSHLQGLRRIAGQQNNPIHIPERVTLQQMDVADAFANLSDSLGREPTDLELADHTGLSVKRLAKLRTYRRPVAESGAMWESPDGEVMGPAVEHEAPQRLYEEFVYGDLSPRDQLIMDYALGRNDKERLPAGMIARRLGITPGAVSQRLSAIQARLNAVEDMEIFGE